MSARSSSDGRLRINDSAQDAHQPLSASAEKRQPAAYDDTATGSPLVSGHPPALPAGDDGSAAAPAPRGSSEGRRRRHVAYADATRLEPIDVGTRAAADTGGSDTQDTSDHTRAVASPQWMTAEEMARRQKTYAMSAGQTILHFGDDDDDDDDDFNGHSAMTDGGETTAGSPLESGGGGLTMAAGAGEGASQQPQEAQAAQLDALGPDATGDAVTAALMGASQNVAAAAAALQPDGPIVGIDPPALEATSKPASPPPRQAEVTHRMKHAAFAQLTVREGERFLVLEQQGTSVPILRDFDKSKTLFAHLAAQQPDFRALGGGEDSDDDVEVQSEPGARALERELNKSMGLGGSFTRANSGKYVSPDRSRTGKTPEASSSSSSSSSTSTMSGLVPPRTMWIDVQTQDHKVIEELLSFFPRLDRDTIDDVEQHDAVDTAHWFAHSRYLFANIEVYVVDPEMSSFAFRPEAIGSFEGLLMSSGRTTIVSLIAFSDVTITIHAEPFMGHRGALQALYGAVARRRKGLGAGLRPGSPRAGGLGGEGPIADVIMRHRKRRGRNSGGGRAAGGGERRQHHMGSDGKKKRLTIGGIVAHIVENIVVAGLPDPTACLGEVDRIDEMVLLVTNDSHDLLRRIARVRRILSAHRSSLFRKERFLKQFTSPALRATFISGFTAEQYRHTLGEVYHVAERLEAARDVLTQANSNFVSHISLQVAQVSNHMNVKMKALSQVATVCLPLNIITGLFGMNVTVPYNSTEYPGTLWPFFTVVGSMVCLLLIGIPFIWRSMQEKQRTAMSSLDG